uniref:Uncharacterized protein n=1 Tax=Arundo donax TaxID=35708 RepID=A0A0A9A4W4_ARUDO
MVASNGRSFFCNLLLIKLWVLNNGRRCSNRVLLDWPPGTSAQ